MSFKNIEYWRARDLNPLPGHVPLLELAGRRRRIEAAKLIAERHKIEICEDPALALVQLFNIYYDSLSADKSSIFN